MQTSGGSRNHRTQVNLKKKIKIGVIQMTSVDSVEQNTKMILAQLKKMERAKPRLVCLPENSLYLRVRNDDQIFYFNLKEPVWKLFQAWAKKNSCDLFFGSVPFTDGNKAYNATVLVTAEQVKVLYRKIHLFDVQVHGHQPLRESDNFTHGSEACTIVIEGWKIGLSICYDIRFSNLYLKYAQESVDIILIPSAFLVPTGKAHWHILNRARAIESQAYVISAAQAGTHKGVNKGLRKTYGHSLCVDPWGQIVKEIKKAGPDHFIVELEPNLISKVREQIPMADHRRLC
jgi:deaminated glutathione amidase